MSHRSNTLEKALAGINLAQGLVQDAVKMTPCALCAWDGAIGAYIPPPGMSTETAVAYLGELVKQYRVPHSMTLDGVIFVAYPQVNE